MIVITGAIVARPETFKQLERLALEHVARSRTEPGCLHHSVHVDCENPLRLVFVERWADRTAIKAHFHVPASREFVMAGASLAAGPPELAIYEADELTRGAIMA